MWQWMSTVKWLRRAGLPADFPEVTPDWHENSITFSCTARHLGRDAGWPAPIATDAGNRNTDYNIFHPFPNNCQYGTIPVQIG
jgi:hypothetical protein